MQIPSAIVSGVNGFVSAQSDLTQATIDVARPEPTPAGSMDKTAALIQASDAVRQTEASAAVIDIADEALGSLIDISV